MSHVSTMDIEVNNLEELKSAATALGCELVEGQQTYRIYGQPGKCDHAIRIPGDSRAYEIGVVKRRDGQPGFDLFTDFYAGGYGMEAKVGPNGEKLKQQYSAQHSAAFWRKKGCRVNVVNQANGHIRLKVS